jgi:hypothetical protein
MVHPCGAGQSLAKWCIGLSSHVTAPRHGMPQRRARRPRTSAASLSGSKPVLRRRIPGRRGGRYSWSQNHGQCSARRSGCSGKNRSRCSFPGGQHSQSLPESCLHPTASCLGLVHCSFRSTSTSSTDVGNLQIMKGAGILACKPIHQGCKLV